MLISSLLERAVLPAETPVELLERAGGNPLFAEEFVRMLVDRGLITRAPRRVAGRASCTASRCRSRCTR